MRISYSKFLTWFLILSLITQNGALVWAAPRVELYDPKQISVAIIPYPSSEKDRPFIEETAKAIREKMATISSVHIVDPAKVKELINYHADYVTKEQVLTAGERYLALAKNHWFDHQFAEAEATVNAAISSFKDQADKGDLLVDALLTKTVILKELKKFDESKSVFQDALRVDPNLSLDGMPLGVRNRNVFKQTKKEILERYSGDLDIKTDPPAVNVYINGIKKGVTPVVLKQLPEGSYLLTLEGSHYQTINKPVTVTANTTQYINKKMLWVSGRTADKLKALGIPTKSENVLQEEIKKATSIGETLKVDKVILVSSENKKGTPMLTVRTIDTALKASYNPVGMSFADYLRDSTKAVAQVSLDLKKQSNTNALKDPAKYLSPDQGDIRVLRRKQFFQTPLFYTLLGTVIGGTIGAVTVLLLDDDGSGSSKRSGDSGGIDIEFE